MIENISKHIVCKWLENDIIKKEQYRVYVYGCELIVSEVISTGIVMLAAVLLKKVIEMALFLSVFTSIRVVCGGYHASSYRNCIAAFSFGSILFAFITNWFVYRELFDGLLWALGIANIVIIILAPIDTESRPLAKEEKKKFRRKTICRITIINVISIFLYCVFPFLADKIVYVFTAICYVAVFLIMGCVKKSLRFAGRVI